MRRLLITLTALTLISGACSDDDGDDTGSGDDSGGAGEESGNDGGDSIDQPDDSGDAATSGSGGGTATVELANGDSFEFSILCTLEPQIAAGQEILFTVVSYDDINLDITQFGSDAVSPDLASVSLYEGEPPYDTLWSAETFISPEDVQLTLEGDTVTGTANFYPAGDIAQEPVAGDIVAECA